MNSKNRIRNRLVRRLQRLSADKLTEIENLLGKIESRLKTKDQTLNLAGTWRDLDDSFFDDLTKKLHNNRANDRQLADND